MVVVEIGWHKFVMPREKALLMAEILEGAELYEHKYWSSDKRKERNMEAEYTHHVYPNDNQYSMKILSDDIYRMAKLAGKPEKD